MNDNKTYNIQRVTPNQVEYFKALVDLFTDVFEEDGNNLPSTGYLKTLLEQQHFIVLVALSNETVVGGITGYEIKKYYNETSELFIYDLAVHSDFRRHGIGKKLMNKLQSLYRNSDLKELFVLAEKADENAVRFYQSTGGRSMDVISFDYPVQGEARLIHDKG